MKAVILAGGKGTRLAEETQYKPKPLVEAGGKPLLWHIMQNFYKYSVQEFIILAGYKGDMIKDYFANFWLHESDVTFDLATPKKHIHQIRSMPWKVMVLDTGLESNTGSRIAQLKNLIDDTFLLTYGDGISDVNIHNLISFHKQSDNFATLTAVQPPARYGAVSISDSQVTRFQEKIESGETWINGGYFVLTTKVFDYIGDENVSFEFEVLPELARLGKLGAYKHSGYWQSVDTIRDLQNLESAIQKKIFSWT